MRPVALAILAFAFGGMIGADVLATVATLALLVAAVRVSCRESSMSWFEPPPDFSCSLFQARPSAPADSAADGSNAYLTEGKAKKG